MQALILTCLLCLQTPNPCDPNPAQPFNQGADCSKCLTELQGYLNLPNDTILSSNSTNTTQTRAKAAQDEISPQFKENLANLLGDLENLVEDMSQSSDELTDVMNQLKVEINQDLLPQSGKAVNAETLKKVQKQESVLGKINEKFKELFHDSDALKKKFNIMRGVLSLESPAEDIKRGDTVRYGEKLMVGEELVSRNGRWRYMMDPKTGEHVLSDRNGREIKRSLISRFSKPISPNLHMVMNSSAEYYWDIVNGKSETLMGASMTSIACGQENARCYLKLDDDGHLKFLLPSGEPSYTYF